MNSQDKYEDLIEKGNNPKFIHDKEKPSSIEERLKTQTFEAKYPELSKQFLKIQKEQYELFAEKQLNYGPNNITLGTNLSTEKEKYNSLFGLVIRLNDKVQRLLNLISNKKEEINESIEDNFLDISIYGIISLLVKREKWKV